MEKKSLDELLSAIHDASVTTIAKNAAQIDKEGLWPEDNIRSLLSIGLGGLTIPISMGGHGHGVYALAKICQMIGQSCPSTALCYGMHCVGSSVIATHATPQQIEQFIEPICMGQHITSLSLSEPGTGAHFYLPETSIVPINNDNFLINGVKTFVTNGSHADSYVISGISGQKIDGINEFSCFILSAQSEGLSWGAPWAGLGMRGNSSLTMTLNDVKIKKEMLLGKEGDQIWYTFNVIAPYFLMAMAGTYLGIANRAFTIARDHLIHRTHSHSGRALASSALLQQRIATVWGRLQATETMVLQAATRFDAGDEQALPLILAAKAEVAECAVNTVNEAMTLVGGKGYAKAGELGRLLRDVRAAHIMSPTTDLLHLWVGRLLLNQPILSDED